MQTLNTQQLKELRSKSDVPVINVLSSDAYDEAHIPGSASIPSSESDFVKKVEQEAGGKDKPIVVYCASESCDASPKAARKLEEAGFTRVYDYEAGTQGWQEAGERIEGAQAAEKR